MTFTDEEIKKQKEKVVVLEYLVDGLSDDYNAAANRLTQATLNLNREEDMLQFMKLNQGTK